MLKKLVTKIEKLQRVAYIIGAMTAMSLMCFIFSFLVSGTLWLIGASTCPELFILPVVFASLALTLFLLSFGILIMMKIHRVKFNKEVHSSLREIKEQLDSN